jgi:hypothetical protein
MFAPLSHWAIKKDIIRITFVQHHVESYALNRFFHLPVIGLVFYIPTPLKSNTIKKRARLPSGNEREALQSRLARLVSGRCDTDLSTCI